MDENAGGGFDSFQSIAEQIQDRALILASERGLRDVAELERDETKILFETESKQNQILRRKLLKELRMRHGYELELFRIKEQHEEHEQRTKQIEEETERLKKKADELDQSWEQAVKSMYAPHKARREFYQECLERRIHHRQRQTKLQQDRLAFLVRRTREMQDDEKRLVRDKQKVERETEVEDAREDEEDEAVSSLALQIKATLSKRSALRRSVQDAKKAYRQANDEMIRGERECTQNRE